MNSKQVSHESLAAVVSDILNDLDAAWSYVVSDPDQDLAAHKKQGPSFLSRMGDSVRAAALAVRGVRARPQEFGAMQEYADEFSCKMAALDKVTQRIIKEQNGGTPHGQRQRDRNIEYIDRNI